MITRRNIALALAAATLAEGKIRFRAIAILAHAADPVRRAVPGGRFDRCRGAPHRRAAVAGVRPAGLCREQVRRQRHHRHRGRRQERAGRLHHPRHDRRGGQQSARLSQQRRSLEGSAADHPAFAPADRAGGPSLARRQFGRRIDCAGKEAAGPALRDRQRRRDRRSTWPCNGSRRSPASSSSRCPIAAADRRSTICSAAM